MLGLEAVAKARGGKLARGVARQAERLGDRRPEQKVAERIQHKRERAFGNVVRLVTDRELGNQGSDRNRGSGSTHPGCR